MLNETQYQMLVELRQAVQARRDVAQAAVSALKERIAGKEAELPGLDQQEAVFDSMTDAQKEIFRDQRQGVIAARNRLKREIAQLSEELHRKAKDAELFRQQLGLFYVPAIKAEMTAYQKAHGV